jgi:hypothetical protein
MPKESIKSKVVKDVKAAEKAIVSEEKMITTKIKTKTHAHKHGDFKAPGEEHIEEEE